MSTERGRIRITGFETDHLEEREPDTAREEEYVEPQSMWRRIANRLVRDRLALIGITVVVVMAVTAFLARPITVSGVTVQPFSLAPYDPTATAVGGRHEAPSLSHYMGTDRLGRDLFSRVMVGGRYSISIGLVVTALASTFGVIYGSVSGYFGGWVDSVLMRFLDLVFAFPALVLALILVALFGGGFWPLVGAFVLVGWASYARIIRGEILKVKQNEYVLAAKALGARDQSVLFRHIIPNAIAPVIVQATLSVGTVVIGVAALGFLGIGFDPGTPEWGTILDGERDTLATGDGGSWYWWATVFPGLMIFLFVMSMNMIGDVINDALDTQVDDIGGGG
ncbi:ABC transporter permease [Natronobacterium gregoryi]|uniref:ABC transporter permease n=2 Tax=Natronobacterium gregoryi TaxID=44930 RepID=L0AG40_NATGS|nr:ABC transporter permease [Natronobacterium gregoryi]AFZ72040.1 ABC-type dipeptide/oligopeptide/nickel transport system, permease component [Natronobacterium gregoryi SP2]ELY62684.1 binding-protein-dependent transport system inner membrane protein [Natronobacterium gregoryi SP2]PLK20889.1 ABC transporter permease [Natronobacterium gregoryi SP2]SFJ20490.1 peptide/nickel transport system permease protein [Natronobacterium gregoryi]